MNIDKFFSDLNNCFANYQVSDKRPAAYMKNKVEGIIKKNKRLINSLSTLELPIDPILAQKLNGLSENECLKPPKLSQTLSYIAQRISNSQLPFPQEIWERIFFSLSPEDFKNLPRHISKLWNGYITEIEYRYLAARKVAVKDFRFISLNKLINCLAKGGENITYLDLRGLHVRSSHIEQLVNSCAKLQHLFLNSMFIYNTDFEKIINLKNLTELQIQNQNITEIPKNIQNLTNLENLSLQSNYIDSIPNEIMMLTRLTRLDIPFINVNKLTDLTILSKLNELNFNNLDNEISLPQSLKSMKFGDNYFELSNYLTSSLNSIKLTKLDIAEKNMQTNRLDFIESQTDLTNLSISTMELVMAFSPKFNNLKNLKTFNLKADLLNNFPNFENFSYLTNLSLKTERLLSDRSNINYSFLNLPLKKLCLCFLDFMDDGLIDRIYEIGSLKSLYLGGILFNEISNKIKKLSNLNELSISNLSLTKISEKITELEELRILEINCPINELPDLTRMKNLKTLSIVYPSKNFNNLTFKPNLGLEYLKLKGFSLKNLPRLEFITSLRSLHLESMIDYHNDLKFPNSITELRVWGNFDHFPEFIYEMKNVKNLDLYNFNKNESGLSEQIISLTALKNLMIYTQSKSASLPKSLGSLLLRNLDITGYQTIPKEIGQIYTLQTLIVDHSNIDDLKDLKNIQYIRLYYSSVANKNFTSFPGSYYCIPNNSL